MKDAKKHYIGTTQHKVELSANIRTGYSTSKQTTLAGQTGQFHS